MRLSVREAAERAPHRTGLIAGDRRLSFAEIATLARGHQIPAVATSPVLWPAAASLEALVPLYALLDAGCLIVPVAPGVDVTALAQTEALELEPPALAVATSGSTAHQPKHALLTHAALIAAAEASAARLGWRDDDRWLLCLPLHRIGGLSIVIRCLWAQRAVVLLPRFSAAAVVESGARHRVTLISLVPAMLRQLLDRRPVWQPPDSLRAVLLGGAGASAELLREAGERGIPVLPTYGMTETAAQVSIVDPGTPPDRVNGVGRPLPGYSIRLGADDRVEIKSPSLFSAYLEPVPRRLSQDGYWCSDDAGRLDDGGRLHVLGRLDDVIVSGGEKLHPASIEALLSDLPGVRDVMVFAVPDATWGAVVGAALIGQPIEPPRLRAALESRVRGAARPRHVIWVEAFPTAGDGKPQRRNAATLFAPGLKPI